MKHVQVPPDGEVLPLDPTTIFFRPADDDPLPFRLKTGVEGLCSLMGSMGSSSGCRRLAMPVFSGPDLGSFLRREDEVMTKVLSSWPDVERRPGERQVLRRGPP
jgi:hypothetical protein